MNTAQFKAFMTGFMKGYLAVTIPVLTTATVVYGVACVLDARNQ